MSWKRVLFYSVISLMGLDIVAASPRASTDDIQFDPNKQQIIGDAEASKLLTRTYREPFVVPELT